MDAIRKIIEKHSNPLTLVLPDEYKDKKVEVIVMALEEDKPQNNLSAFFGKLEWKGDALAEQKKLRDEWE